jgi:hypothetical protein
MSPMRAICPTHLIPRYSITVIITVEKPGVEEKEQLQATNPFCVNRIKSRPVFDVSFDLVHILFNTGENILGAHNYKWTDFQSLVDQNTHTLDNQTQK